MFFKTLPPAAQRLFARLGRRPEMDAFYLAGGSAAALHLGHRVSVDLDFFSPEVFDPAALVSHLSDIGPIAVQQESRGTFVGQLAGTQVSFFYYAYPLLEADTPCRGVRVASLLDIALMKLAAISQRGRRRDFVDLYCICKSGYALADLLRRVPEKYATLSYPSYHLLRALAYFDDAEEDPPLRMLKPAAWARVKRFYEDAVRQLADAP